MSECVPEEMGDGKREQDQAVAICLQAWRDRNKGLPLWMFRAAADDPELAPYGDVDYADPGLQEDGKARYPIDTEAHIRAAWNYINKSDNQKPYTADQVRIIKKRIIAAWKKKIDPDGPPGAEEKRLTSKQIPSPHEGESQSAFLGRCRDSCKRQGMQELQATEACQTAWAEREDGMGRSFTKQDDDEYEAPDVQEDESRAEYIDRCTSELIDEGAEEEEANSICALAWENRSGSARLRRKVHTEIVGSDLLFCLSDETPDRMGDIISSAGWDLVSFKKNPIALFNHRSDFVVGTWRDLHVADQALRGHLQLAPEGTSERIDEIRKLVEAGILKAVSVGFKPISSKARLVADKHVGEHFLRQELVETSLVSVPANPNALAIVKSLDISADMTNLVFGEHARAIESKSVGGRSFAKHGVEVVRNKEDPMSQLTQRIEDTQARINQLRDKLTDHLASVDDSNVSDTQYEVTQDLNQQIAQHLKQLEALRDSEKHLLVKQTEETTPHRNVPARTNGGNGNGSTAASIVAKPYINTQPSPKLPEKRDDRLELVVRAGVIQALSHVRKISTEAARLMLASEYPRYGDDITKTFLEYVTRGESAPAMTTVEPWAGFLAQTTYADYMDLLYPKSVFPQLAGHGLSLQFGRAGRISIPMRAATPSISGSFVGEGQPIPVRQAAFGTQVLVPKKMAVITTWTREMDQASIPAIEGLLRNAIQEDTAITLDNCLLDNNPATVVRPAGILNGVTPIAASPAATPADRFGAAVNDLRALTGALLGVTRGNIRNMVLIMNPQEALALSLTAMPGVSTFPFKDEIGGGRLLSYPVIQSGTVDPRTIIAIDAADFVVVGGEAPRFEVSDQATLHMQDDDTVAPIVEGAGPTGGATASPVRSLWQTDSLGLRLILPVNWTVRRAGVVAAVENVNW